MQVLVTGGAGYIGSHTCKALAAAGFEPITFDNLSVGHRSAVKWGPLIVGDLADGDHLRNVLQDYEVQAVLHFAAHAYVGESVLDPRKYYRNNVSNTLDLLNAMIDTGISTLVFSSTCATYGLPRVLPIPEVHPQNPVSPYGESKLFVERAISSYADAYGLSWTSLRYFNAAGADPDGEIGENHQPETHLIPLAAFAALEQSGPLHVFGRDYATADGTCVRDYIHVSDLADAHVKALQYLLDGGRSSAFNLGTGQGHSVLEVIRSIEAASGRRVPHVFGPRRKGDASHLVADAGHAGRLLNWEPKHPELNTMVESALQWWTSRQLVAV